MDRQVQTLKTQPAVKRYFVNEKVHIPPLQLPDVGCTFFWIVAVSPAGIIGRLRNNVVAASPLIR